MSCEWYEAPIRVERDGVSMIVPVCHVHPGDRVWSGRMIPYTVTDLLADDEEEVMYIKVNAIDAWPAEMFLSE